MATKKNRLSSTSWARIGIIAGIASVTLAAVAVNYYPRNDSTKTPNKQIASTDIPAPRFKNSAPSPEQIAKKLVRAWNQGRAEDIASLFTSEGLLILPTGSQVKSRGEIRETIRDKRGGLLKNTKLTNIIENISHPDGDRAIVKGRYRLEGIKILGASKSATGSFVLHQVREHGHWLISRAEMTKGDKDKGG